MIHSGCLIPAQRTGLTTTLLNKFLKVKYEEDIDEYLEKDNFFNIKEETEFSDLFDNILQNNSEFGTDFYSDTLQVIYIIRFYFWLFIH